MDNHFIVAYRLHRPGKDYDDLYEAIKGISGTYWHNTTSSWIVATSLSSKQIFDQLEPHIDDNDELAVFELEGSYYGQLKDDDLEWLEGQLSLAS